MSISFGVFFLVAPHLTMDLLAVRASPEAAILFRLYGIAVAARGVLRHAAFRVPEPRIVLRALMADLAYALPSALVLIFAIGEELAGGVTWAVVALFGFESMMALTALAGLWSVSRSELERTLTRATSTPRREPENGRSPSGERPHTSAPHAEYEPNR